MKGKRISPWLCFLLRLEGFLRAFFPQPANINSVWASVILEYEISPAERVSQSPSGVTSSQPCPKQPVTSNHTYVAGLPMGPREKTVHWAHGPSFHAAAAKSLQSCPTLCDPIDGSPPSSPVPGILQAGTLEWIAIAFSNAWKWKVEVKSFSCVQLFETPWTAAHHAPPSIGTFQARALGWGVIAFSGMHH